MYNLLNLDFTFGDKRKRSTWEALFPVLGSFIILFLCSFLKKFVFRRIGVWFVLKKINSVSKAIDAEQVEEGLKSNPTILKKFTNSCYRFFAYTSVSLIGIVVLWDKPWLWDVSECWRDFFNQTLTDDVWWYFMICWSFAWSLLISLFVDEKGKDFFVMLTHHAILTIVLNVCWKANLFRIGTFVLLANDVCDIFFEGSKIAKYLGYKKISAYLFYICVFLWASLRVVVIPLRLFESFFIVGPKILPTCNTYLVFQIMVVFMSVFFILNCIWVYFLLKVAISVYRHGVVTTTDRSVSEY